VVQAQPGYLKNIVEAFGTGDRQRCMKKIGNS
jgi:hypothetical protein